MHESLILNVMEKLLYGDIQILEILRSQYRDSKIIDVECSNVGFFVNFEVDSNKIDVDGIATDFDIGDLYGTVDGIQGAVGFILFVIDGKLSMLEGYTNAIDVWPADEDIYLMYDSGFDRNLKVLEKQWKDK